MTRRRIANAVCVVTMGVGALLMWQGFGPVDDDPTPPPAPVLVVPSSPTPTIPESVDQA